MQHWDLSPDTQPSGQDGPFVLFSTPEARGIVIALAQGRQLGEHRVRERSIVCVLDGSVELTAGGKTLAGYSGTVTTFDPSEAHAIRALEDSRLLVVLAPCRRAATRSRATTPPRCQPTRPGREPMSPRASDSS